MKITTDLKGFEAQEARFKHMGESVKSTLRAAILSLSIQLERKVVQDKLSGQVLKRVSGDLSRSINHKTIDDGMTGVVGANAPYAARQEYGFTGTESVRAFVRRSHAQMATAKFNKAGLETRHSVAKAKNTGLVMVKAHSRKANTPARSFLRSALADMREDIRKQLDTAIMQGLKNAA